VELQAIARVHRIGQTRPTTVWMYLVNDTVEEAIYDISVTRRLAHVQSRQSQSRHGKSRATTPGPLQEIAIDAANSEELQSTPISKLLAGKGGGEAVRDDDLWLCLFGKANEASAVPSVELQQEVGRHLRAEAAGSRRANAS
jgi:E3 ubiquitin-protein ligase SHPRH